MGSKVYNNTGAQNVACPKCGGTNMMRIQRRGFWQEFILPSLGLFPWECVNCRKSSLLRNRGTRIRVKKKKQA